MYSVGGSSIVEVIKKGVNLQNFKTLQFMAEFLFFSKYGEQSPIFQEFLIATQMIKFVFKMNEYYRSYRNKDSPTNILLQKNPKQLALPEKLEQVEGKGKIVKLKEMLQKLKKAGWTKSDHQPQMFQTLQSGKKMQLITSQPIPNDLIRKRLTLRQMIGQFLLILRPLISILAIRCFGEESYLPYFLSLGIELFATYLQRKMTVLDSIEVTQIQSRQRDIIWRCLFKRPFFQIFKNRIIKHALGAVMAQHRILYRIIMYIVEIQSSITLTI